MWTACCTSLRSLRTTVTYPLEIALYGDKDKAIAWARIKVTESRIDFSQFLSFFNFQGQCRYFLYIC